MSPRFAAIEARRARLLERAALEREELARTLQSWSRPLSIVDRCIEAVRFVAMRPPLVAAAALAFTLLRPRSALRWARRAWGMWQGYRWLNKFIAA